MSEIQRLPSVPNPNPVHPNAKSTSQMNNGTTTAKTNISSPVCRNCKTQTTPLWRRDETGQVLCNACGLFLKLHGRPRPISLKTDTIKSRNRIKHPNFTKFSGPHTPELKSKDSKAPHDATHHLAPKTSPKPAKKSSPHDSPSELLLSMSYSSTTNTTPNVSTAVHSPLSHPARAHYQGAIYHSQGQAPYSNLPPQVQSLHYPSSTPTQFAPGLQRITSPLLLSTTPSVSNARFSNSASSKLSPQNPLTAVQAAGALENMSNELGPSATFKGAASTPGSYSLMNSSKSPESALSTPSSALKSAPTLPALGTGHDTKKEGSVYASPSFGPQFHLQDPSNSSPNSSSANSTPIPGNRDIPNLPKLENGDHSKPSLPPLNNSGVPLATQLPQLLNVSNHSSPALSATDLKNEPYANQTSKSVADASASTQNSTQSQSLPAGRNSLPQNPSRQNSGNGNNDEDNNGNDKNGQDNAATGSSFEVSALKTRISELELVNDLYRTRIMELEAMEQAARLRENSMKKRLDDLLSESSGVKREGGAGLEDSAKRQKSS